jgi:AcrR family transcriptional regulator
MPSRRSSEAVREQILAAAYELFGQKGVRAVGVDAIIGRAGVAKATFYHHFPSKDALVKAFLQRREQLWTREFLEAEVNKRADAPRERLLAIFDVFDEWFQRDDFEGCPFLRTLFETFEDYAPQESTVAAASRLHLANIRDIVQRHASEAGLARPEEMARQWQMLMAGAIVFAGYGERSAARSAREAGELLLSAQASPPRGEVGSATVQAPAHAARGPQSGGARPGERSGAH